VALLQDQPEAFVIGTISFLAVRPVFRARADLLRAEIMLAHDSRQLPHL